MAPIAPMESAPIIDSSIHLMDKMDPVVQVGHDVDGINGRLSTDADRSTKPRRSPATKTTGMDATSIVADEELRAVADDTKNTQCGLGSWRPVSLRPFGTIWSFTAAVSMLWVVAGIDVTYYSAVIPQIERRFGLSSSLSGFIRNVDNVGYMVVILAVSHLGRYANKPRILAASSLLSAISILVFAVPHLLYGGPGRYGGHPPGGNESSTRGWQFHLIELRNLVTNVICNL